MYPPIHLHTCMHPYPHTRSCSPFTHSPYPHTLSNSHTVHCYTLTHLNTRPHTHASSHSPTPTHQLLLLHSQPFSGSWGSGHYQRTENPGRVTAPQSGGLTWGGSQPLIVTHPLVSELRDLQLCPKFQASRKHKTRVSFE